MADTWNEAAFRARLAATAEVYDVIACRELDRHAFTDLRAALAEIDRLREIVRGLSERVAAQSDLLSRRAEGCPECARLRAALLPFAELARRPEFRGWSGDCGLVVYGHGAPNLGDCRRAAEVLGGG